MTWTDHANEMVIGSTRNTTGTAMIGLSLSYSGRQAKRAMMTTIQSFC